MATKVASNADLLNEILLRLPVKPLLRFKCVSKHWLALISEPKFCHSHTIRQYHTSPLFPSALLLATNSSSRCPIIPLKRNNVSDSSPNFRNVNVPNVTVLQSCNGLLLLERKQLKNASKVKYFIYNPTTNQSVAVSFPTRQFRYSVLSLFLCFEPLKSPHYKLVSIRFKNLTSFSDIMKHCISRSILDDPEYVINVYSSETRSWSVPGISFTAPDAEVPDQINAVYFNGALYWYIDVERKYRYFDLETQSFKTFLMPSLIEERRVLYFGESGGHLHFVVESRLDWELDILELNEENSKWSVRFHVNLNPMRNACPHLKLWELSLQTGLFFVYCVVNQQNDEDSMFVFFLDGKVMSYNLVDSTFLELSSFSSFLRDAPRCYVYQHYENLSWVGPTNA